MKYRNVLAVIAALALASTACGSMTEPTGERTPEAVSFVHDIPAGHPRLPYFDEFARTVDTRSERDLAVRINPQKQVLAGRASLDAVGAGEAHIAAVNMAHLEAMEPAAGFMNLPFGVNDTIMSDDRKREALVATLADQLRPHGVELLGVMRGADQLFAFPQDDVSALQDLRGKRIRVAGSGIYEDVVRGLGAEPVPMPIPEIKEAMAQGTVDGIFTSPGGWSTEVLTDAPHAVQIPGLMFITYGVVADADWLAGLSEQERAAVIEAGAGLTGQWEQMQEDDQTVVDRVVSDGDGTYLLVDAAETARWRNRVYGIVERFLTDHHALGMRLKQEGLFAR